MAHHTGTWGGEVKRSQDGEGNESRGMRIQYNSGSSNFTGTPPVIDMETKKARGGEGRQKGEQEKETKGEGGRSQMQYSGIDQGGGTKNRKRREAAPSTAGKRDVGGAKKPQQMLHRQLPSCAEGPRGDQHCPTEQALERPSEKRPGCRPLLLLFLLLLS